MPLNAPKSPWGPLTLRVFSRPPSSRPKDTSPCCVVVACYICQLGAETCVAGAPVEIQSESRIIRQTSMRSLKVSLICFSWLEGGSRREVQAGPGSLSCWYKSTRYPLKRTRYVKFCRGSRGTSSLHTRLAGLLCPRWS